MDNLHTIAPGLVGILLATYAVRWYIDPVRNSYHAVASTRRSSLPTIASRDTYARRVRCTHSIISDRTQVCPEWQ